MSNARAIALLLLGILLAAGAHVFLSMQGVGAALVQKSTLLDQSAQEADRIAVERGGAVAVVLECGEEGGWRLVEPYAAAADERSVLRLIDAMTVSRIQATYGEHELAEFGRVRDDYRLDDPPVRVSLSRGGESWKAVSLGAATPTGDGVFAAVDGDPSVYLVDTNVMAAADAPADAFRLRALCPGGADGVDSFDLKRGKGQFLRFVRDGEMWRKAASDGSDGAESASSVKIREFLSAIGAAEARGFAWPVGAEGEPSAATAPLLASYGLDPESAVAVTLHSRGRPDRQIAFGKEAKDGLVYALVQDSGAVATVEGSLKDAADGTDFLDSRLFPFEPEKIERVSITDGAVNYLIAKGGDGAWRIDAPVSAAADPAAVDALVKRLASLTFADRDPDGVAVSLSTNAPAATVSRDAAFAGHPLEDVRSREILRIAPADARRIEIAADGAAKPTAVAFDKDLRTWVVESSELAGGAVAQGAVDAALAALDPLEAVKVVKLKASVADLRRYGLERPRWTVAVDSGAKGAIRRNVLIGERAQGGRFATTGASDSVFVVSDAAAAKLTAQLVQEPK